MRSLLPFFNKQHQVEELIQDLLRCIEDLASHYREAMMAYLSGQRQECEERSERVDRLESELDDLGRRIQFLLLREDLMPDSRDDILWLLTKLDRVPGRFRHSLQEILLENPRIPEPFHEPLIRMLEKTHTCIQALDRTVDALFGDLRSVRQHAEETARQESEVDKVERKLLQEIFADQELGLARQYQLKGVVQFLGGISDLAEDVADAVLLIATKRLD